jgi:hypothetical protein
MFDFNLFNPSFFLEKLQRRQPGCHAAHLRRLVPNSRLTESMGALVANALPNILLNRAAAQS